MVDETEVSFADKLGTEDKQILGVSLIDGELQLVLDKPETITWQELIYFIKYVIADALSKESDIAAGDIFQWLGAQEAMTDKIMQTTVDIIEEARQDRIKQLMQDEQLRLDRI